jgi:hypothetical protein
MKILLPFGSGRWICSKDGLRFSRREKQLHLPFELPFRLALFISGLFCRIEGLSYERCLSRFNKEWRKEVKPPQIKPSGKMTRLWTQKCTDRYRKSRNAWSISSL